MLPVNVSTYLARGGDKALIWEHTDAKREHKFYCFPQHERITCATEGHAHSTNWIPRAKAMLVLCISSIFMFHHRA